MYKFKDGQILRTSVYWRTPAYRPNCLIPDCEIAFKDKAHEWAHAKFHIVDNKRQLKQLASR